MTISAIPILFSSSGYRLYKAECLIDWSYCWLKWSRCETGFSLCCGLNRCVSHTGLYIRRSHFFSSKFTSISRKTYTSGSVHPCQYLLLRQKKNLYKANHTAAMMNTQESFHSHVNWPFWHFMNKNWGKCYLLINCFNTYFALILLCDLSWWTYHI